MLTLGLTLMPIVGQLVEFMSYGRGAMKSLNIALNCFFVLKTFLDSFTRFLAMRRSFKSRVR